MQSTLNIANMQYSTPVFEYVRSMTTEITTHKKMRFHTFILKPTFILRPTFILKGKCVERVGHSQLLYIRRKGKCVERVGSQTSDIDFKQELQNCQSWGKIQNIFN